VMGMALVLGPVTGGEATEDKEDLDLDEDDYAYDDDDDEDYGDYESEEGTDWPEEWKDEDLDDYDYDEPHGGEL